VVAGGEEGEVAGPGMDYSVHPLVLGPAYNFQDIEVRAVNKLDTKVSGVTVVGMNKGMRLGQKLRQARLLTTFQVGWCRAGVEQVRGQ
jgi:hypothetical protein